ncbi:MAG: ammonium transporter [Alphaproteobacteria bacterium]|nr:ammonium transporter [Alphaproteobacteria bacterium]
MRVLMKQTGRLAAMASAAIVSAGMAHGQEATVEERLAALEGSASGYVDNSYLFLISGLVVMFMAAGFCMLESGLVRSKNAAMQSTKNIALFSVAGLMFYLIGYQILYPSSWIIENYLGMPAIWAPGDLATSDGGYASSSDWYFQMVFVATAASIVSGTVAERVRIWPFLIFTAFLTGIIYPIQCSWQWGEGWLYDMGFSDFAGSTLVHSVGGWAALVGAIVIGPRTGKYFGKAVNPMPGSNIPLAALGTFILWFGWFGFNGGSQLAAGGVENINSVAKIFVNTNMAAVGGVLAAMILTAALYKGKIDSTMAFNGAIGGLVSITAEPLTPAVWQSVLIGGIGGVLVVLTVPMLDRFKIDDVVGAIPAHLVCGIWGTLAVPITNTGTSFLTQLIGVVAIGAFVVVMSAIGWFLLKLTLGVRASEEEEMEGLDKTEIGLEAYPEFAS